MSGASIEPDRWTVIPEGIEATRFSDPESFYLSIRKARWRGDVCYIVSATVDQMGFTRNGHLVYLRHDVNSKHARHESFETACDLARSIADGHLSTPNYRPWRAEEARRWTDGGAA